MDKLTTLLGITIVALCLILAATMQSKAQEKSFSGLIPFVTSNDRVGFLDQSTGRIYVYDSNISQCLFIGQIQSLGQPIQVLTATTTSTNNE